MAKPNPNMLQELLAATAGGAPPEPKLLKALGWTLQSLTSGSTGACHFFAGGKQHCCNLTETDCSGIAGSHFDGVNTICPNPAAESHGISKSPALTPMTAPQITQSITALLRRLHEVTRGGETLTDGTIPHEKMEDVHKALSEARAALKLPDAVLERSPRP